MIKRRKAINLNVAFFINTTYNKLHTNSYKHKMRWIQCKLTVDGAPELLAQFYDENRSESCELDISPPEWAEAIGVTLTGEIGISNQLVYDFGIEGSEPVGWIHVLIEQYPGLHLELRTIDIWIACNTYHIKGTQGIVQSESYQDLACWLIFQVLEDSIVAAQFLAHVRAPLNESQMTDIEQFCMQHELCPLEMADNFEHYHGAVVARFQPYVDVSVITLFNKTPLPLEVIDRIVSIAFPRAEGRWNLIIN